MSYKYYQQEGGDEVWKPIPVGDLDKIAGAMFTTILSVDSPVSKDATKEDLFAIKYHGPLYFDLDDASSPVSTAKHLVTLIGKLREDGLDIEMASLYATGGKGFHMTIPMECFIEKPPKAGLKYLPAIYKEIAYVYSVDSMDFRVYTARRGRMFRMPNVLRPNGRYKVQITYEELVQMAKLPAEQGAELYAKLCSAPRDLWEAKAPIRAFALQAAYDMASKSVSQASSKAAKLKPPELPDQLPSFEALLRGEGIRDDVGFQRLAMQIAITAHAIEMSEDELIAAAAGLCETHKSDGDRYNTPDKRRFELRRMYEYAEDNVCYPYSGNAIRSCLTHQALDLAGVEVTEDEVREDLERPEGQEDEGEKKQTEFDHAGVMLSSTGVFVPTEGSAKQILAMEFSNVTELVSAKTNMTSVLQADVSIRGRKLGTKIFELDSFSSAMKINQQLMPMGQVFSGNDTQSKGLYLRLVEKAQRKNRKVYTTSREGLDVFSMNFHHEELVRNPFPVWSDQIGVVMDKKIEDLGIVFKFVGFPNPDGVYQSDLSMAPSLSALVKDPEEKERLRTTMWALFGSQETRYFGKLLGWMVACHYRMYFHINYSKFPLLHINGAAGAGKTEGAKLLANLHYYRTEPKMLTPSSTMFAVRQAVAASASIPLILDEFKPGELSITRYDEFKLMLRDAYNNRETGRGGGTRESADYRSVHTTNLSAPICFISEATESESALMERVVLLTLVRPSLVRSQEYLQNFMYVNANKDLLGVLGSAISRQILNKMPVSMLPEMFEPILDRTRKELMLQPGDVDKLDTADIVRKSGAKERTVFNYAVLRFGLERFAAILRHVFGNEFDDIMKTMDEEACSTVQELQQQTLPEWLKVFNAFSSMALYEEHVAYSLVQNREYGYIDIIGSEDEGLEIDLRTAYMKYRMYCNATATKPLYPSEMAFVAGCLNIPAFESRKPDTRINAPGGMSYVFNLSTLRMSGFVDLPRKART